MFFILKKTVLIKGGTCENDVIIPICSLVVKVIAFCRKFYTGMAFNTIKLSSMPRLIKKATDRLFQWEQQKTLAVCPTSATPEHTLDKSDLGVSAYGILNSKPKRGNRFLSKMLHEGHLPLCYSPKYHWKRCKRCM